LIASPASARREISSTLYHRLFPNTRISNAKDTELEFATTLGGNRLATSVGGTLTGRGGNLIIIDDPLKPLDAYSQAARENTKQWYSNTLLSRLDHTGLARCRPIFFPGRHLLEQPPSHAARGDAR
jgi:hypothetical protein